MRHRVISIVAVVALLAGCAGPSAHIGSSGEAGSALPVARDFTGTWHGSYWQFGMVLYNDDADCTLQINEDSTFTAKCMRSAGANNLAKPSSWSGRVLTNGNGVVLQDNDGPWPWIMLRRSGDDILYGTSTDPLVGATVEMTFERAPRGK